MPCGDRKNRIAGSMLWTRSKSYIVIPTCEGEPNMDGRRSLWLDDLFK